MDSGFQISYNISTVGRSGISQHASLVAHMHYPRVRLGPVGTPISNYLNGSCKADQGRSDLPF